MKASARNQLIGTINKVQIGTVNAEVHLEFGPKQTIIAAITKESAENLKLTAGMTAVALIKAPQIIIVTDFGGYRLSARNQLQGIVSKVIAGAVNSAVDIELASGETIAATVTNTSAEALGLRKGQQATAVFKASAVILAIPG